MVIFFSDGNLKYHKNNYILMKDSTLIKKLKLLKKPQAMVLWLSCIEKERFILEIIKKWNVDRSYFYSLINELTSEGLLKKIKTERRKGNILNYYYYSNLDWLYDFYIYNKGQSGDASIEGVRKVIDFKKTTKKEFRSIVNSQVFRKICMPLKFILFEAKYSTYEEHVLATEDNLLKSNIGLMEWIIVKGVNENKLDDYIRKHNLRIFPFKREWYSLISQRLEFLGIFKSFQRYPLTLEYIKKFMHISNIPIIALTGELIFPFVYKKYEETKLPLPSKIKPYFTPEDIVNEHYYILKKLKKTFPELYNKLMKKLKEK